MRNIPKEEAAVALLKNVGPCTHNEMVFWFGRDLRFLKTLIVQRKIVVIRETRPRVYGLPGESKLWDKLTIDNKFIP